MSEILASLKTTKALDLQIDGEGLRDSINRLRQWQCQRLLTTHQELYRNKRYTDAIEFFVAELYGPNDFSQRDQDIEKAIPLMETALSDKTLNTFHLALKLNLLSFELDYAMACRLEQEQAITSEIYAQVYRDCQNQDLRETQLSYIEQLAMELNKIANRASIMMVLKLSRIPANLAGLGELQRILETGASAFRKIGNIERFIDPILAGETEIMQALFSGENCLPNI